MEETGKVPSALARRIADLEFELSVEAAEADAYKAEAETRRAALRAAEKRAEDAEADRDRWRAACNNRTAYEALAASQALTQRRLRLLEAAWAVIANAGGGDWATQSLDWCLAAASWRDEWHAALAESPDHVAPAPEADPKWDPCICGHSRVNHPDGPCDGICNCRKFEPRSAQEATASPAPERVCCFCGAGMSHGNFECPNSATILPAPPEEAAPQAQDCGCKGSTCEWTDKPIRRAAQDDPEVSR